MRKVTSVAVMLMSGVALGIGLVSCGPSDAGEVSSSGLTASPSSTTAGSADTPTTTIRNFIVPSTTTPLVAPTTTAPPVQETKTIVQAGDQGLLVETVQQRLKDQGYDPGEIDGKFGPAVTAAVRAFQRVNGLEGDGDVGPLTLAAFENPKKLEPMRPEGPPNRVEVSISRKLLALYKDGAQVLVTHISSGSEIPFCENGVCGDAKTPVGDFTAMMTIDGWEEGPLGAMFNSVYFWPAYAVHGSPSVPDVGASHGCIRIPMHIAEYFPSMISYGEPIYIMA